jgi:hypothetical protein
MSKTKKTISFKLNLPGQPLKFPVYESAMFTAVDKTGEIYEKGFEYLFLFKPMDPSRIEFG